MAFYPTRKMWDAGIRISGASDGPVTSFAPLEEMEAGITRNSPYPGEEDTDMYRWPEQALTWAGTSRNDLLGVTLGPHPTA